MKQPLQVPTLKNVEKPWQKNCYLLNKMTPRILSQFRRTDKQSALNGSSKLNELPIVNKTNLRPD